MSTEEQATKKKRAGCLIVIAILVVLYIIGKVSNDDKTNTGNESVCNDIVGFYSGTSQMGYTTGSASLRIDSDCSADLSYDQGDYGGTSESGYIEKEGSNYKFHSTSGGGTYDLYVSNNKIVLEGYNWKCVMTK